MTVNLLPYRLDRPRWYFPAVFGDFFLTGQQLGARPLSRRLRIRFLSQVLGAHGFETDPEGDGIDVNRRGIAPRDIEKKLEMLGFLLGFTRLLDQRLEDTADVEAFSDRFLTRFPPQ